MFDIHCPVCNRRSLMSESSIESLRNTHEGPVASLSCYNGHQLNHYFQRSVNRTVMAPARLGVQAKVRVAPGTSA